MMGDSGAPLLIDGPDGPRALTVTELADDMAAYWDEHDHIHIDADARAAQWFEIDLDTGFATQTICDPAGFNEWVLDAEIDLEASDEEERAVVIPVAVRRR